MKAFLVAVLALTACGPAPAVQHPGGPHGFVITPGGGGGGSLSGGSSGKLVRWTGASTVGQGSISDDGSNHVTVANTSGYAYTATPSGTDTDNRGFQCSSTWSGATGVGYCFHGLMTANSAVTAYAEKLGCTNSGGGGCRALELSDGDFFANTQGGGKTRLNGVLTEFTGANSAVNIGLGGTSNVNLYEKHNTVPTLTGASCTGTGGSVTGSNLSWTITAPSTATACDLTFNFNFTSAPSCTVTPIAGATFTVAQPQTSKLPFSAIQAGQLYMGSCIGH